MRVDGAPPISVALLNVWTSSVHPSPNAQEASTDAGAEVRKPQSGEPAAQARPADNTPPLAGRLRIEFDDAAGLYVQTLTDPQTHEVLRQYPSQGQLHFARAVRAYVNATHWR